LLEENNNNKPLDLEKDYISVQINGASETKVLVHKGEGGGLYHVEFLATLPGSYKFNIIILQWMIHEFSCEITGNPIKKSIKPNIDLETPPEWVSDDSSDSCTSCFIAFGFFNRRHHCRNCGNLFCGECTALEIDIPKYGFNKPVRVCVSCYFKCKEQNGKRKSKIII